VLPDDPAASRRLLRAARCLLDWSQSRLAAEVGASTATVNAVETGRLSCHGPVARAMIGALSRHGVHFVAAEHGVGAGVRYTRPPRDGGIAEVIRLRPGLVVRGQADRGGLGAAAAGSSSPGDAARRCLAAAERQTAKQREVVARLEASPGLAHGRALLAAMERSIGLLRRSEELIGGVVTRRLPRPGVSDRSAA
jgi:DNA-binding XRE family transcriptional regulator